MTWGCRAWNRERPGVRVPANSEDRPVPKQLAGRDRGEARPKDTPSIRTVWGVGLWAPEVWVWALLASASRCPSWEQRQAGAGEVLELPASSYFILPEAPSSVPAGPPEDQTAEDVSKLKASMSGGGFRTGSSNLVGSPLWDPCGHSLGVADHCCKVFCAPEPPSVSQMPRPGAEPEPAPDPCTSAWRQRQAGGLQGFTVGCGKLQNRFRHYPPTVLETTSPKSRCQQGCAPSRGSKGGAFLPLPGSGGPWLP